MKSLVAPTVIVLSLISGPAFASCQIAEVLFGKVMFDIIPKDDYETALVRHGGFDDPKRNFGAFRGEITVDRGGFSIRNNNQEVIGTISPKLQVEGWDDACDRTTTISIRKIQPGAYVIMNGKTPVGTIEGRFPKNGFGVR